MITTKEVLTHLVLALRKMRAEGPEAAGRDFANAITVAEKLVEDDLGSTVSLTAALGLSADQSERVDIAQRLCEGTSFKVVPR